MNKRHQIIDEASGKILDSSESSEEAGKLLLKHQKEHTYTKLFDKKTQTTKMSIQNKFKKV